MGGSVMGFGEIEASQVALVGGKGAQLGELSRIRGISVPAGFCVTTDAFTRSVSRVSSIDDRLERLSRLAPDEHERIRALSAELRRIVEETVIPEDVASAVTGAVAELGRGAFAVRSSATAEDLPTASFAGQHDTYLNVDGPDAVLTHVSRCWGSLFTERAVSYRLRNGIEHRAVRMAVVVQRMVSARAAGVLFTADPLTSNRRVVTVEAGLGLAEDLVSGMVKADVYKVRDGEIVEQAVAAQQVLAAERVVELAQLGRRLEAHFGSPQDIEWCLDDDGFQIVQCRPITTLFPVPAVDDGENHVYLSVGHQQMMTDAMKPLGLSFWQMTTPRPMAEAGGRLFVDVTPRLSSPKAREALLEVFGRSDPLIVDVLRGILARGDFIPTLPDSAAGEMPPVLPAPAPGEVDPAIVPKLIADTQASIAELRREIAPTSGPALLDFILADMVTLRRILFDPQSHAVFMTAMEAAWWLNEHLQAWLGEKNAADTLTQSVPHNVTSEMGLALLDVADAVRPHPEVLAFLRGVENGQIEGAGFLDELVALPGGAEARRAIDGWLEQYGMRCVGEIDITRPRWSEQPAALVPLILSNVKNFEPGAGPRRFERGRQEAERNAHELLERLRSLPDGERKAEETERMIARVRNLMGYREYPKYGMVSRYWVYKQALLEEAERLVQGGVLREKDDIFLLRFEELHDVVRSHRVDYELIRQRKEEFRLYRSLTPPRVLTSDGEALTGTYRRDDLPAGALLGLAVSAGTVEGRARVMREVADAALEPGDILVTAYTDPSWTPVFVTIAGLVTEVGGVMTHGAVIAREYGLPAVVNVQHATGLIEDGQRIRVNGTDGYVEILSSAGIRDPDDGRSTAQGQPSSHEG